MLNLSKTIEIESGTLWGSEVRVSEHERGYNASGVVQGRFAGSGRGCRAGEAYGTAAPPQPAPAAYCAMDVDGETDSNHDTALTLACAGGHEDLVELLLLRGADIEHRDKKVMHLVAERNCSSPEI